MKKDKINKKYGEFIPSEFNWILPEEQKENAKRLEKITKNKNNKNK